MNTAKEHLKSAALLGCALVLVLFVAGGCKKKSEPAPPAEAPKTEDVTKAAAEAVEQTEEAATEAAEETKETTTEAAKDVKETVAEAAAQVEQTTCPVMDGNPIDKNVFVEYQGKKVYFCCADCKAKFEAEPEKYLDKLPQFKQ